MRRWFLLTVVLGVVLALVACNTNEEEPEVENDATEEQVPAIENDEEVVDPIEVEDQDEVLEQDEVQGQDSDQNEADLETLTVDLIDTEGNEVGTAELTEQDEGVQVKVKATDLPEGPHGFHFHEAGKCEAPDFESAGGHFNPTGASHGLEHEDGPHAGDLPNLEVPASGEVDIEILAENVTLKKGEENSLLQEGGTALIIHAEPDDGVTQPSGDSGDRIVCGVVEAK